MFGCDIWSKRIGQNLIFARNKRLEFGSLDTIKDFFVNAFEQNAEGAIALAKSNLNIVIQQFAAHSLTLFAIFAKSLF